MELSRESPQFANLDNRTSSSEHPASGFNKEKCHNVIEVQRADFMESTDE